MQEKTIPLNHQWSDDTVYVADRTRYEITMADTVWADDPRYTQKGHDDALPVAFYIRGKKNITLDFGGATVFLRGKIQPFILDECENVTVKNVKICYDRCPYTQGTVVSADENTVKLRIGEHFPYRVEDGELIITADFWENRDLGKHPQFFQFFDGKTLEGVGIYLASFGKNPYIDPGLPWAKSTIQFVPRMEGELLALDRLPAGAPIPESIQPGQIGIIAHESREICGILMMCCKNVTLQQCRIFNGRGMGIAPIHCENILLDGIRMTYDAESPGIIANAADAIHAFACSGQFIIENCILEGMIDDALNIHSNFYRVKRVEGNRIIADTGLEPYGVTPLFLPGDRIAVYRGYTTEKTAEYTITAQRPLAQHELEITLDRPAEAHSENDAIENLSTQCDLTITNCKFRKSNTHLRFQTRGTILVENCETELPFWMTGDMTYWFESSPCDRFIIRNTAFTRDSAVVWGIPEFVPSKEAPFYHGDLILENCTFTAEDTVQLAYSKSFTAKNCRNTAQKPLKAVLLNCGEADAPDFELTRQTEETHELKFN